MKRLVLLTVILVPSALHAIGNMSGASRPPVTIGPRAGRGYAEPVAADDAVVEETQRIVRHLPAATPERAKAEAWQALHAAVARWLAPAGVPEGWTAPEDLLRAMVREEPLEAVEKDYGTIYVQPLSLDASDANHARLLETYEREVAGRRLAGLAGILAFVLTCLAAVAGYIRADEATRGYYTNTLRVAAVAAVGAVGAVLYYALA